MPRKTKKISIAKPEVTKHDHTECYLIGGAITVAIGLLAWLGLWLCAPAAPYLYACYQHREESGTVAQITSTDRPELGANGQVAYSVAEEPYFGRPSVSSRFRSVQSFNELYKKMDSCDKFFKISYMVSVRELLETNESLKAELDAIKKKKHR